MDIEKHILKKLIYSKGMSYNTLREDIASNKFAYHLKKLVDEGIILKKEEDYILSAKGTQIISALDGQAITEKRKPVVCVFILGSDGENILLQERKKQPFMDYYGIPGGKIEYGSRPEEEARREFLEETGMQAQNMELKLVASYRTYDKESEEITHHMIGLFYLATKLSGNLITKTREGNNVFVKEEELNRKSVGSARVGHSPEMEKLKLYPDMMMLKEEILDKKGLSFKEIDRYTKDGDFVSIQFLN